MHINRNANNSLQETILFQDHTQILEQFHTKTEYSTKPPITCKERLHTKIKNCNCKQWICSILPIVEWLPQYTIKKDLVFDLIAGITVAVLNIPQSLAYAMLAYVPAEVGLYMAFFPALVYFLFGTSRQCNIGTFAVICLLSGKVVLKYATDDQQDIKPIYNISNDTFTPIQVGTITALTVGLIQVFMYIFHLGYLSRFLSQYFISGFVSAAALQIYLTQIPELFGLKLPKRIGYFKLFHVMGDIFNHVKNINLISTTISLISLTILLVYNKYGKPRLAKVTIFPLPIELLLVIITIIISYFCKFKEKFHVRTVGFIPSGFPSFEIPKIQLLPYIIGDCFAIALVSYALLLSVGMLVAAKHFTKIDCNQEALAAGLTNIISCFFKCVPTSVSLSRTLVQDSCGGRTQLASVFSALCVLIVMLKLGMLFEALPRATLAVIIIVALKGAVSQVCHIKNFWRQSKINSLIYLITFAIVLFIDIQLGLFIGLGVSLALVLILGIQPYTCLLGAMPHCEVYLDVQNHKKAKEIPNIKIFHYASSINFAQIDAYENALYTLIECDPIKVVGARRKELNKRGITVKFSELSQFEDYEYTDPNCIISFRVIILDFSAITYIDPVGVQKIATIAKYFNTLNVTVLLASPSDPVFEMLKKCDENPHYIMFPTIPQAVKFAINLISRRESHP